MSAEEVRFVVVVVAFTAIAIASVNPLARRIGETGTVITLGAWAVLGGLIAY